MPVSEPVIGTVGVFINKEPVGSRRIDHIGAYVKEHFVPIGSLCDNEQDCDCPSRASIFKEMIRSIHVDRSFHGRYCVVAATMTARSLSLTSRVSTTTISSIFHGFEDPVVERFYLFVGITDQKFLFEVFEEVLFGLITSKNQVGVVMGLFKETFKGG
jgi:hypothetical protein